MINVKQAKSFCCDDISMIENYKKAVSNNEYMWHCHHKLGLYFDKQWMKDNGFYYEQRAEMLIFMKPDEHLSLHKSGNKNRLGQTNTKEHNRKISEANRGKCRNEETKKKISEISKGRYINRKDQSKKVIQLTRDGEVVAQYPSINEAQRQTCVSQSKISLCCNEKRKTAGGFLWRFAD